MKQLSRNFRSRKICVWSGTCQTPGVRFCALLVPKEKAHPDSAPDWTRRHSMTLNTVGADTYQNSSVGLKIARKTATQQIALADRPIRRQARQNDESPVLTTRQDQMKILPQRGIPIDIRVPYERICSSSQIANKNVRSKWLASVGTIKPAA